MSEAGKLYEIQELLKRNGGPLPLSLAGIYKLVAQGKIPAVSLGRRKYVPGWWVESLLADPTAKEVR